MPEFRFEWRGNEVADDVLVAANQAMDALGREGEAYLRSETPVRTGFLRDSSYVIADMTDRGPILVIGQGAAYASYVELGTRFMAGHYQITHTAQWLFPQLPARIGEAIRARGYDTSSVSAGSSNDGVPNPYTHGPLQSLLPPALREAPLSP